MKKTTFLSTVAAAAVLLIGLPSARAMDIDLAMVTPLDTFNFDIVGANYASNTGHYLTPDETATFGTTQTYTGVGIDGQNITITSSETVAGLTTTDTFTVSTPTNFITDDSLDGSLINLLQFDLGDANSGNPVSVLLPIASYTSTGSILYGTSSTASLTPTTMLGTGDLSYAASEGVHTPNATTPIDGYAVQSFTYSITYSSVPEPSTWAILVLGGMACAGWMRRQRTT